jgi:hypothetical protein
MDIEKNEHAYVLRRRTASGLLVFALALPFAACEDSDTLVSGDAATHVDAGRDAGPPPSPHPGDIDAATAAFKLYYVERVHRVITSYNRFATFGDSGFSAAIGALGIARDGDEFEIIPGPTDNNQIGTAVFNTYQAYRALRTRTLEVALIRMFRGLEFIERVTGVPGLTVREAYPGWTRVMDGIAGTVTRTRDGKPAPNPMEPEAAFEAEVLETFYRGVRITYRENPAEFLFTYMPATNPVDYAVTHSFSHLPRYLHASDCCSSLMRTPAPHEWEGAFWGNHNSRDNFPDFGIGFVAAFEASEDPNASADVREAARLALAAGQRIADLIQEHGGTQMTIDEWHDYGQLTPGGERRPHGLMEAGDPNDNLGGLAACPDIYLARAISSHGLASPVPELPLAGTLDDQLAGGGIDCPLVPFEDQRCRTLQDAYCGLTWETFDQLAIGGVPVIDLLNALEQATPGSGERYLASFQGDFEHIVKSMAALAHYARVTGDDELQAESRRALAAMTEGMRVQGDLAWGVTMPERAKLQRFSAALLDAIGGTEVHREDLGDFAIEEARLAHLENLLQMADTEPDPLRTDEEILALVEGKVTALGANTDGWSQTVYERYRDAYGMEPPLRRAGDGYEARQAGGDWMPAEVPHHLRTGVELLTAVATCQAAPEILDCTWARLGCARPDLNGDGMVDADDRALFEAGGDEGDACDEADDFCDGADLDRSGRIDEYDRAFMDAAEGCHYEP